MIMAQPVVELVFYVVLGFCFDCEKIFAGKVVFKNISISKIMIRFYQYLKSRMIWRKIY